MITNAGLICFTMNVLWNVFDLTGRMWIFIGFQWVLISIQFIASEIIDDVPPEVDIQLQRNDFIHLKVIEKVADEDYGVVHSADDEDELVDEGRGGKKGPIHCGNLCGFRCKPEREHMRTVRSRRIRTDLEKLSVFDYPTETTATGAWPKPLSKSRSGEKPLSIREMKAANKKAAMDGSNYDTSSYVSNLSAVAAPSNGSGYSPISPGAAVVDPNAPAVPTAANVGARGYAAVPPPAPGYV